MNSFCCPSSQLHWTPAPQKFQKRPNSKEYIPKNIMKNHHDNQIFKLNLNFLHFYGSSIYFNLMEFFSFVLLYLLCLFLPQMNGRTL